MKIPVLLVAVIVLAGCTPSANEFPGPEVPPPTVSKPEQEPEALQPADMEVLLEAIAAPGVDGGSGGFFVDGFDKDGNRVSADTNFTYQFRPAISDDLIRGADDKERFLMLALMLRDAELEVHFAAAKGMKDKFGYKVVATRKPEDRRARYEAAMEWWNANKNALRWNDAGQKFVLS